MTRAEGSARKHSPDPTILAVFGIGLFALLAEIAMVTLGFGSIMVRNALVTAASFSGAAITLLTAAGRPRGARAAWLLLGLGIFSYSLGSLLLFFFLETPLTTFPSTADLSWLTFYPLVVAAVILLARGQRRSDRLAISLDAAIVTLAFAAISYELIFNALIDAGVASDVVGGQLSYSVLDFGVLVMLTLVCAPSRVRVGKAYLALGAGLLVMLVSDVLVVRGVSNGTYAPGTLPLFAWRRSS